MGFRDVSLNAEKLEAASARILQPMAEELGVPLFGDVEESKLAEGAALNALRCGAELHLRCANSTRFPAYEKRVARIGAKAIAESPGSVQAGRATVFLALAFVRYLMWTEDLDPDETLERIEGVGGHPYLAAFKAMHELFPPDDELQAILDKCEQGYRALFEQDGSGDSRWTSVPWAEILEQGEEPSEEDDDLQRAKAANWYIGFATRAGVELGLPRATLQRVEENLSLDLSLGLLGDSGARYATAHLTWNDHLPECLEEMMNIIIEFPALEE